MELFVKCGLIVICMMPCSIMDAASDKIYPTQIHYHLYAGKVNEAISLYENYAAQLTQHDHELIQQIGLQILEQGSRSTDPETQLMTLFGIGLALHEKVLHLLEKGLKSPVPQLQLVSLNFIGKYQDAQLDRIFLKAMASNYLIIRLEALYQLAIKKDPQAIGQAEALMTKIPRELLPLFPQFFALIGNREAIQILRKMFTNQDEMVRVQAVLSAAKHNRDDLLPLVRILAAHHTPAQAEASAYALGLLKDDTSKPKLESIANKSNPTARLAALQALYQLGKLEIREQVESQANTGDLFAINVLGGMPGSQDCLYRLSKSSDVTIRYNAAIALLQLNDPRSIEGLSEILIRDTRDLAIEQTRSPGMALTAYKVIPSARQTQEGVVVEGSLRIMEGLLEQAQHLPEDNFLRLASTLLESRQTELVPTIIHCLEKLGSEKAIAFLKHYHQLVGSPLIRNYCNLALYRLKEEGPYLENLINWVNEQNQHALIQFRSVLPSNFTANGFQLTPEETSRLLVEAFETFTKNQDVTGINILLKAIQNGNPNNRYALAGLLIRATL